MIFGKTREMANERRLYRLVFSFDPSVAGLLAAFRFLRLAAATFLVVCIVVGPKTPPTV